jgi:ubiquitin C-terminal hydrolase
VSRYPDFKGSDQHDAIEFLNILIDNLHEDLRKERMEERKQTHTVLVNSGHVDEEELANRRWEEMIHSNGSIITELFSG